MRKNKQYKITPQYKMKRPKIKKLILSGIHLHQLKKSFPKIAVFPLYVSNMRPINHL